MREKKEKKEARSEGTSLANATPPPPITAVSPDDALSALTAVEWYLGTLHEKALKEAEKRGFLMGQRAAREKPEVDPDTAYARWNGKA